MEAAGEEGGEGGDGYEMGGGGGGEVGGWEVGVYRNEGLLKKYGDGDYNVN